MDVLETVRKEIERKELLRPGASIVVGVSGGSDSLCLLHVIARLRLEYDWSVHVAHLNHCLRDADADEDMVFVTLLAMDWGLPCILEAVDVAPLAQQRRMSIEETARQARYAFLADVAKTVGANAVAVGHQADDQSETVLMHILRGTGLAGLRGMLPEVDLSSLRVINGHTSAGLSDPPVRLVRPLLSVPRIEIERYCRLNNLSPRFDRSNLDKSHFRNRLRHELLPLLETYNPNIKKLLQRTAAVATADFDLLEVELEAAWTEVVREENENAISFDLASWRALPLALQRATVRHAAYSLRAELRDVSYTHVRQALEVANNGPTGAQATLPQGLRLTVGYKTLRLSGKTDEHPLPDWPLLWRDDPLVVAIPGQTKLPNRPPASWARPEHARECDTDHSSEWLLEVLPWTGERKVVFANPDRWTAYLDADRLAARPTLRPRRPGDRFQPLGMRSHEVEVADFMVNAKIPSRWRERVPLLINGRPEHDGQDEIAWVVGWRIDERVKITPRTQRMMRLRWLKTTNSGAPDV